ncbi:glycoside hydrolase family 53 protein [Kineococcus radiotolerans]|uniref:glycoside hydrolase family 53 protein n=1 Tax=Kineococcus radiotolerans TaxID=131568 RepID=UPI001C85EBCB|nr:arabinogalactan endo-1,4-beta-galactosidase [Kineococcus radiotolerans]
MRGADLSFLRQSEAAGARYADARGKVQPAEKLLRAHGANWVRLRVWVDPPTGYSDNAAALELALRAKRAGMKVLIDLHYSDFWADPAHQTTPAAWAGQDLPTLAATVRAYTAHTLRTLHAAGARVDMVQVGNEVTAGMLWPLGQIYRPGQPDDWTGFTTLLKAGIAGVRDVHPRPKDVPVMVHIDRGGDNGGSRWFYDHVLTAGVEFEIIGQSYYPFWHGSLHDLQANFNDLAARYGKDLVLVETAYPWTLQNGDDLENLIRERSQLPDAERFPATPAGQAAYFKALREVLLAVPHRRGLGFFAWEPAWLPGVGWEPGAGNPNDNLTMFDHDGRALPALNAFRPSR